LERLRKYPLADLINFFLLAREATLLRALMFYLLMFFYFVKKHLPPLTRICYKKSEPLNDYKKLPVFIFSLCSHNYQPIKGKYARHKYKYLGGSALGGKTAGFHSAN
jgi:hypothetical protein